MSLPSPYLGDHEVEPLWPFALPIKSDTLDSEELTPIQPKKLDATISTDNDAKAASILLECKFVETLPKRFSSHYRENSDESDSSIPNSKRHKIGLETAMEHPPDSDLYCICRQISYGDMVCCENPKCATGWFHFGCVGLVSEPNGQWLCNQCKLSRDEI